MLVATMSAMMEQMSTMSVHALAPPRPGRADGLAADVYAQMRRDFFVASPFVLHGELPPLLAATWALVRETLFTGEVERGDKEILAWAISEANECPFCISAHHAAVRAYGEERVALYRWAKEPSEPQPFSTHITEHYGTTISFHYLNRMVSVFLDDKMMPTPDFMSPMTDSMAQMMMGGMMKKGQANAPGDALALLPAYDEALAWRPGWATDNDTVAQALAGWSGIIEMTAREYLDAALLDGLASAIDGWDGILQRDLGVEGLRPAMEGAPEAAVDLSIRTAVAPHTVTDAHLKATLDAGFDRRQLLALVSWSAQRAARSCGERLGR